MSVSIKYKGAEIASASTEVTKTIKTAGKYCEADILVENTPDGGGITPTGNINITDTNVTNVTNYATAQVIDADLVASNIKKDVNILGVVGTFEGGGGGSTYKLTTVVTASRSINTVFDSANIALQSQNEVLIWNIRGTVKQSSGSVGGKMGVIVVQNGNVVSNANMYKRSSSIVAPDSMTPQSSLPPNSGVFSSIVNGVYTTASGSMVFAVGVGNYVDFIQIPYNIGWAVSE